MDIETFCKALGTLLVSSPDPSLPIEHLVENHPALVLVKVLGSGGQTFETGRLLAGRFFRESMDAWNSQTLPSRPGAASDSKSHMHTPKLIVLPVIVLPELRDSGAKRIRSGSPMGWLSARLSRTARSDGARKAQGSISKSQGACWLITCQLPLLKQESPDP